VKLTLYRINEEQNTTIGALFVDGKFQCFTLEDENRLIKVKGKTRIPDGTYQIKQRKEVSPLTERYRQRYQFFDFHFEIQNVPNFTHVYIHVGNDHSHTDGCILVGNQIKSNTVTESNNLGESANAFENLYVKMKRAESIEITIQDVDPWR